MQVYVEVEFIFVSILSNAWFYVNYVRNYSLCFIMKSEPLRFCKSFIINPCHLHQFHDDHDGLRVIRSVTERSTDNTVGQKWSSQEGSMGTKRSGQKWVSLSKWNRSMI